MMTKLYLRISQKQELCFLIEHRQAFNNRAMEIVRRLAQIIPEGKVTSKPTLLGRVVQTGPRISTLTPWSSSATEILDGCGIRSERFEVLHRYAVPKGVDKHKFAQSLFDPMTEQVYDCLISTFNKKVKIPKVRTVPILEKGRDALREISEDLGLGLDSQDIENFYHLFAEAMGRNATDAEMFVLGQALSDHCRHKVFNGIWTIDGVVQKETLFDLIRKPYNARPGNALVAFHDNSSVIRGFPVRMAVPKRPWTSSEYVIVTVHADGTLTFETHNHPTAISPFPGAATGTGGRMRDGVAVGIGGRLLAACAGFFTGHLNLKGYKLPWEKSGQKYPPNLATAADIQRLASDGACGYNNPGGEPVIVGCGRSAEMVMPDGTRRSWFKPIMASGGIGMVRREHIHKAKPKPGMLIVMIGGPAFNIGFGGGSASSQVSGDNKVIHDFKSVQRGDPEMAIRNHLVIKACIAMGIRNPIRLLHDQGAGGVMNVLIELVEMIGGKVYAGKIRLGDMYLPFIVRLGAEYQERYGLLLDPAGLKLFLTICKREHCPVEVLGEITGDGKFTVYNDIKGDHPKPIELELSRVMTGMPPKQYTDNHVVMDFPQLRLPANASIRSALNRVLRNLAVSSKEHYTLKGDRSVGGLVVQQQHCGPANLPVADSGVVALSPFNKEGQVFSIGEQPLKLTLDPMAGARMAFAEATLNMAGSLITSWKDIVSSVNWMWAALHPGEGAAMFDACGALSKFMMAFGRAVRGKDSCSMKVKFNGEEVPGIRQVMITMQAMMRDVGKVVTPDIKAPGRSGLWLIDLGFGKNRMGGSILAQCYGQFGKECPDIDPDPLGRAFNAIQELVRRDLILAYHDRSDGGLIVTLSEMAFTGNCGIALGFKSSDIIASLFAEEAGAVIEVREDGSIAAVMEVMNRFGLKLDFVGNTIAKNKVSIMNYDSSVFEETMTSLRQTWRETSYQLRKLQINPDCALAEKRNTRVRPGISYVMPKDWDGRAQRKVHRMSKQPKVAILREMGTNSEEEMVASFIMAGFQPVNVAMSDLVNGTVKNFNQFSVLAACGGFSNGDVLGSARGWAMKILYNAKLHRIFWQFMKRQDVLSYWTCNGAQLALQLGWFPYLPEDGRPVQGHPVFTYNASRKFEARWPLVGVQESPSIMLRDLVGCRLGVHVAHGEGRFSCRDRRLIARILKDKLAPVRFVDDNGIVTEDYPFNPNGSPLGITGLTTPDGRHTIAMPHFERSVQMRQWQYVPENIKRLEFSPWLRGFEAMRNFYK